MNLMEAGTAIYVALAVALSVWIGIFFYLWRIDSHARELKRRLERDEQRDAVPTPTATLRRNMTDASANAHEEAATAETSSKN